MILSRCFCAVFCWLQRRLPDLVALFKSPQQVRVLLVTATLLSCNWGLYIYGVNIAIRVIETSLGYYINPLVTGIVRIYFPQRRLHWGQQVRVCWLWLG